jgi:hypothetical protein
MVVFIEEEGLDEDGLPMKCQKPHHQQKCKCKQAKKVTQDNNEDNNNDEFLDSSSGNASSLESESNMSDSRISNNEVHFSLHIPTPCSPALST